MTDTTELKAEAKAEAKTIWGYVKYGFANLTSILSDMLKAGSPQFAKAETTWKTYAPGKKAASLCILALIGLLAWKFGVDVTRLSVGSFRAASAYGRNAEVTQADLVSFVAKSHDDLQAQIDKLSSHNPTPDPSPHKGGEAQGARITTGSLPKKTAKHTIAKKSSFSVPALSKFLP